MQEGLAGLLQNLQLNILPFLSKGDPDAHIPSRPVTMALYLLSSSIFTTELQGLQYSDPDGKENAQ